MLKKIKSVVRPTKEEVSKNEQKYLETIAKLESLEKEYAETKKSLKCRYCGREYYARGYCCSCLNRLNNGLPLERMTNAEKQAVIKSRRNNLSLIYEEPLGKDSDILISDFMEIVEHYDLDDRSKEMLYAYFLGNQSYCDIGKKYNITRERVRQIIDKAMRKCNLDWK